MEDAEAGRQSKAQVPFEATENSRPMTDLFGEKVHEGRGQQPRKKRATGQPKTGSRDWPKPETIAVEFGSAQPYPVECWGPLRNVIDVINDKTGVGFEVAAASLIPAVALLAQTDYRAVTLGADAPLGIYMMGLVSSGGRKTTSYQLAFKAHIDADENVLARYEAALDARKKRSREEDGGGEEPRYPRREPPHALHTDVTESALILLCIAYSFSIDIRATRGASITGDEPFYLLTTQSLLADGDFDLTNQYETRSYESFFDHPDELWRQSVPQPDGDLLSPHNPGLSFLVIPGFGLGGLTGAQVQLMVLGAATMAMAFVLADRLTGHRALSWVAALGVGLSATAFIYSTEIYPEFPAALLLVLSLLLVTRKRTMGVADGLLLSALLTVMCWLGIKYAPLALLMAGYFLLKANRDGRSALLASGVASAGF